MKLEMTGQMRMEQKMKLAPRMIQSMEILQLSVLALQERIEQELNSNPVLEIKDPSPAEEAVQTESAATDNIDEKDFVISSDGKSREALKQIDGLSNDYKDYMDRSGVFQRTPHHDEPDLKLEAIKNTTAPQVSILRR